MPWMLAVQRVNARLTPGSNHGSREVVGVAGVAGGRCQWSDPSDPVPVGNPDGSDH